MSEGLLVPHSRQRYSSLVLRIDIGHLYSYMQLIRYWNLQVPHLRDDNERGIEVRVENL